jgi:hypothetical protein
MTSLSYFNCAIERKRESKEKERKDNMRISVIPMNERKKNDVMYIR